MISENTAISTDGTKEIVANTADSAEAVLKSLDDQYFVTDACANLTNKKFARDVDSVIQRAKNAGVKKIIVSSTNIQSGKEALRLTRLFPNYVYCTAGVHPNEAKIWDSDMELALKELLSNPECVAIGPCGLDYTKNFTDPEEQKEVLEKQIKIATDLSMPIFVFAKEAHSDLMTLLKQARSLPQVVIHSFCGSSEELDEYLSLGLYIGLTGSVWKDKPKDGMTKILESKVIPLDQLLVQSDSPFMYPNTRANHIPSSIKENLTDKSLSFLHRYCTFQRNEPCSLPVTIELLAAYYELKPEEVALQTTFNALKVFGLN